MHVFLCVCLIENIRAFAVRIPEIGAAECNLLRNRKPGSQNIEGAADTFGGSGCVYKLGKLNGFGVGLSLVIRNGAIAAA